MDRKRGRNLGFHKRAWSPTLNPPPDPVKPRLAQEASAAAAKAAAAAATAAAATGGEVFWVADLSGDLCCSRGGQLEH